jgi:TolA-binding protein
VKDPQRLLDAGATELELALLQAGDADQPSAHARQAALAALGLGAAVLSAPAPAAAATGSAAALSGTRLLVAKWWLMAALVTASGAAGLGYATLAKAPVPPPSVHAPARRLQPVATPLSVVLSAPEEPSAAPPPVLAPSTPERQLPTPARVPKGASGPGIEAQIALIDRARAAVAAHEPAQAMSALSEYQRRFPGGVLTQEATLLRIEALVAQGDQASAARLGRQFLARYPRSQLAARVKTLIGE